MRCFESVRRIPALRRSLPAQLFKFRAASSDPSLGQLKRSLEDPDSFWGKIGEDIKWYKKPDMVMDARKAPLYRWFSGGLMNTCYNCLDRHVEDGYGDQVAYIYDSPVTNTIRKITYSELTEEVKIFAGLLIESGVKTGDRVMIYMPNSSEAGVAMLACARIGAVHSVVFGGFAPHELATRIKDCTPSMIICSSCGIDAAKIIEYKPLVDAAIEIAAEAHKVDKVIVLQREQKVATNMIPGRDIDWKEGIKTVKNPVHECVPLDSSHPLYILYTSGTTGQPKGENSTNDSFQSSIEIILPLFYNAK